MWDKQYTELKKELSAGNVTCLSKALATWSEHFSCADREPSLVMSFLNSQPLSAAGASYNRILGLECNVRKDALTDEALEKLKNLLLLVRPFSILCFGRR